MTYYGPKEFKEYAEAFWYPSEWLHSEWSAEKQDAFNNLYNLGVAGWYPFRDQFDTILDREIDALYLDRNFINWSDVIDPRSLKQARNSPFGAINFISDNVKRLYR